MGFQIAPMVDVVFVLLLFFMASAGTKIVEKELSINLPSGAKSSSAPAAITPIVIEITSDGQVTVNDKSFGNSADKNLLQLREWLKGTLGEFGDKDPVIVRPSPDVRQERVVDVLNACAAAKVKNLTFG